MNKIWWLFTFLSSALERKKVSCSGNLFMSLCLNISTYYFVMEISKKKVYLVMIFSWCCRWFSFLLERKEVSLEISQLYQINYKYNEREEMAFRQKIGRYFRLNMHGAFSRTYTVCWMVIVILRSYWSQ